MISTRQWFAFALLSLSCAGKAETGTVNVPSINREWTPDDRAHDVISNGQEACGPTAAHPEGTKLHQCPEQASSAKPASGKPPAGLRR